ncbi:DNA repair protein RecO [Candidatus Dojkabacteria bacterium]|uniref:DNA repair protein RecO n=1 Tax=Candidatus Dojkabacteria bacterium TaxID=2099670 RepID=A0A955LAI8_9BACT|nr:DNA repair protein RecO [Candidatus Dojkabacteria bacterium]
MSSKSKAFIGIIYRLYNSGATDKIVVAIDNKGSRLAMLAKGARKSSSKKSSYLEIGNYVKGSIIDGYAIPILNEVTVINEFSLWKKNVNGAIAIQFVCEIIDKFCIEDHEDLKLFNVFHDVLKRFDDNRLKMLLSIFCLKILDISGHTPESAQLDFANDSNENSRIIKTQKFILNSPVELSIKVNLQPSEQEKMLQLHMHLIEEILEYPLKSRKILFNIMKIK